MLQFKFKEFQELKSHFRICITLYAGLKNQSQVTASERLSTEILHK